MMMMMMIDGRQAAKNDEWNIELSYCASISTFFLVDRDLSRKPTFLFR